MKKILALIVSIIVLGTIAVLVFKYIKSDNYQNISKQEEVKKLPDIDKTLPSQRAIRDKLVAMLDPKDSNSIFTVVDAIQKNPSISISCHDIAHDLGHHAYEFYGFSDAMTFNNSNHVKHALVQYICAGGYMHGILEELSLHHPEFLSHPEVVCDQVPDSDRASCFHGMGHVFMLNNMRDTPASILGCRVILKATDMYRCFEGVRMEQFWGNADYMGTTSLGWDLQKPLEPCIGIKEDEKPTCFLYSSFGYLRTHAKDYSGAAEMCTKNNLNNSDAGFCLKGLGMTMMSKFRGENMEGSEVYVDGFSDENKKSFYLGVMGYARLSGVSGESLLKTCELFKQDKELCMQAVNATK